MYKLNSVCYKKSEPMLTKRARAYSSSCSQVILVYLHPYFAFAAKNCKKSLKTLILGFKVINADTIKKHTISACYGKQHVCAYLQPFS